MINNITISPEALDAGLRLSTKWMIAAQQGAPEEERLQIANQCWNWLETNANPYILNAFEEYTQQQQLKERMTTTGGYSI
jgi:hypothetical protein